MHVPNHAALHSMVNALSGRYESVFACVSVVVTIYFIFFTFLFTNMHLCKQILIFMHSSHKLEHTIFLRRCIQSVYLLHAFCAQVASPYKHFLKSCTYLYLRFCLNSPLVIRIVMRKANFLAFENCSGSSLSFQ